MYSGLATDTQQMFYLKSDEENDLPEALDDVIRKTNEVQDIWHGIS